MTFAAAISAPEGPELAIGASFRSTQGAWSVSDAQRLVPYWKENRPPRARPTQLEAPRSFRGGDLPMTDLWGALRMRS